MDFTPLISLCVLAIIGLIYIAIKYYKQKQLFELVSWSAMGDYSPIHNRYSRTEDLILAILEAQNRNKIPSQYKIDYYEDLEFLEEIIGKYQDHIAQLYFQDRLKLIKSKSKYSVSKKDYFMLMFFDFLAENIKTHSFLNRDIYGKRLDCENKYYNTYVMSDFGILCYKLYYITLTYCKESPVLPFQVMEWAEKSAKEVLDTKQILLTK